MGCGLRRRHATQPPKRESDTLRVSVHPEMDGCAHSSVNPKEKRSNATQASRSFYDYVPFGANPRLMGGIRRPHQKEGENIARMNDPQHPKGARAQEVRPPAGATE